MRPCGMSQCTEWCDDSEAWCETHKRAITPPRKRTAYDALPEQVRGIGIVTTRRILVHRPKSVRRSMGTSSLSGFSYSDMRDLAELERRTPKNIPAPKSGMSVAAAKIERRNALLNIVGTLGEGDRD